MRRESVGESMRCKSCGQYKPDGCICNKPDKGEKGGSCNRTACQQPNADYYNKATQKYYCYTCAEAINYEGGRALAMEVFGTPLLCEKD